MLSSVSSIKKRDGERGEGREERGEGRGEGRWICVVQQYKSLTLQAGVDEYTHKGHWTLLQSKMVHEKTRNQHICNLQLVLFLLVVFFPLDIFLFVVVVVVVIIVIVLLLLGVVIFVGIFPCTYYGGLVMLTICDLYTIGVI